MACMHLLMMHLWYIVVSGWLQMHIEDEEDDLANPTPAIVSRSKGPCDLFDPWVS